MRPTHRNTLIAAAVTTLLCGAGSSPASQVEAWVVSKAGVGKLTVR
jgi:hypothetical protein